MPGLEELNEYTDQIHAFVQDGSPVPQDTFLYFGHNPDVLLERLGGNWWNRLLVELDGKEGSLERYDALREVARRGIMKRLKDGSEIRIRSERPTTNVMSVNTVEKRSGHIRAYHRTRRNQY